MGIMDDKDINLNQIITVLLKQMGVPLSFGDMDSSNESNDNEPLNYAVSLLYKQKKLYFVSYSTTIIGDILVQAGEEEEFEVNDVIRVEGIKNDSVIEETKEYIVPLSKVIMIAYHEKIDFEENETEEIMYPVVKVEGNEYNFRLAEEIEKLVKDNIDDGYILSIEVLGNDGETYRLSEVDAIINDVLFGKFADESEENLFVAIPLKSIVSVSLDHVLKDND